MGALVSQVGDSTRLLSGLWPVGDLMCFQSVPSLLYFRLAPFLSGIFVFVGLRELCWKTH